jgi:uncharacterized protein YpuA (DUF1002 family)
MSSKIINEEIVLNVIKNILEEETSKVNRNDYGKVQFKMEELENQLVETIKELRTNKAINDNINKLTFCLLPFGTGNDTG